MTEYLCSTWILIMNCYPPNVHISPLGGKFKIWKFFKQHQFLPDVSIIVIKYYFIPTLVCTKIPANVYYSDDIISYELGLLSSLLNRNPANHKNQKIVENSNIRSRKFHCNMQMLPLTCNMRKQ